MLSSLHWLTFKSQLNSQLFSSQSSSIADPIDSLISTSQQSRAVAYCRQPARMVTLGIEPRWDPWPYICSVSRLLSFFFFFRCSSFDKKGGVGLFYNWCSLTTPYSTRGHIKVGDIYVLYLSLSWVWDPRYIDSGRPPQKTPFPSPQSNNI
jgi:hypothetical protein